MGALLQVTPLLVIEDTTENVEVIGPVPALVATKDGILPVPEVAPKPISGVGTVRLQVNVAPGVVLLKTMEGTVAPAQYVWLATPAILGVGLTTTVAV